MLGLAVCADGGASRATRTLFRLHFDRFDGLMFKAENPVENVCTTTGLPSCGSVSFFIASVQNIAVVVQETAASQAVLLDGVEWLRKKRQKM